MRDRCWQAATGAAATTNGHMHTLCTLQELQEDGLLSVCAACTLRLVTMSGCYTAGLNLHTSTLLCLCCPHPALPLT